MLNLGNDVGISILLSSRTICGERIKKKVSFYHISENIVNNINLLGKELATAEENTNINVMLSLNFHLNHSIAHDNDDEF